jgi:hypothetical protein
MMGGIYRMARRTVVYLGSDVNDNHRIDRFIEHVPMVGRKPSPHSTEAPTELLELVIHQTWWDRVWTLQEVVLGRDATFYGGSGEKSITMQQLYDYADALQEHLSLTFCCAEFAEILSFISQPTSRGHEVIMDLKAWRKAVAQGDPLDILELASTYIYRGATNPRDKLYGFLGLATNPPTGCVDYERPLSHCYLDFAGRHIEESGTLDVLGYVRHPPPTELAEPLPGPDFNDGGFVSANERKPDLPSWCPDWSRGVELEDLKPVQP